MRRMLLLSLLAVLCLFTIRTAPAFAAYQPVIKAQPDILDIDTFFAGGEVVFTAEIPADKEMAIEIIGPEANTVFDVKGRWGPFWMNRGKVELENLPILYALLLPSGSDWDKRLNSLGLGWEQLKGEVSNNNSEHGAEDIFNMFVKLKRSEGLYTRSEGAVTCSPASAGMKRCTARFRFPAATTPGKFMVRATIIAGNSRVRTVSRPFTVEETGFIKIVHDLAFTNALLYGIISVLIALFAGGIMGVIFKKGGGGH
jgi:hypothetical protein